MKPGSRTFWDVFQGESWGPKLPAQWFALSLILQAYLDRVHGFSCHRYGRNFGRNWPLAVSTCRILSLSLSISLSIIYIYRANPSLLYNVYIYDDSYIYICILTYTGVRAPSKLPRQSSGLLAQLLFGWTVISGAAQGRVNSIFMDILYYIYTHNIKGITNKVEMGMAGMVDLCIKALEYHFVDPETCRQHRR